MTGRWASGLPYGAQTDLAAPRLRRVAVLRIEERIAPDRDRRISLGDLAELHPDVTLARARAHGFREHANAGLERGGTSSSIVCMIEGTPAITITVWLAAAGPAGIEGGAIIRRHPD